ncbi:MAG: glutathione S-transferase family protein [Burkholderiaceae bacterium]|nr:glutathione S-transferase family protein [Burkholderiaceae bacterium]MDZ4143941.1 glutathione S-transferase family protein [Burkholderiales bacterium]
MNTRFTLVSHKLCPFVQRVAIVLAEKDVPFERIDIDLARKPEWFLKISPLGKTPVLLIDGKPVFESAVICEYLEETALPRLHPLDPLERARHRGWMELGSSLLSAIGGFYNAPDEATLRMKADEIRNRFEQIEVELGHGPYFAGESFSIVDAVFGPVFRYFDVFERYGDFGFFRGRPRLGSWRHALAARSSVQAAAHEDYAILLHDFLIRRHSALSRHIESRAAVCS